MVHIPKICVCVYYHTYGHISVNCIHYTEWDEQKDLTWLIKCDQISYDHDISYVPVQIFSNYLSEYSVIIADCKC